MYIVFEEEAIHILYILKPCFVIKAMLSVALKLVHALFAASVVKMILLHCFVLADCRMKHNTLQSTNHCA